MNKMIHINNDVNEWCVCAAAATAAANCMLGKKQRNGKTPQKTTHSAKCICVYAEKDGQQQNEIESNRIIKLSHNNWQ